MKYEEKENILEDLNMIQNNIVKGYEMFMVSVELEEHLRKIESDITDLYNKINNVYTDYGYDYDSDMEESWLFEEEDR